MERLQLKKRGGLSKRIAKWYQPCTEVSDVASRLHAGSSAAIFRRFEIPTPERRHVVP
ncbi:hypothetical protein RBWH47_01903 [Rhodopirellula baltica WH47]|uniref:Uncharacterized protein n=2 Tax=Rhodopirellula baltica TaxID=265606 RepID=F2ARK1_RHOBT|nr:hypothetical protein RBWH47_01903 [Rhodopirellula baltica WH47]ELP30521.1 hypothetical protein RBSWK_05549 [Rhodopirellula baltica SWK14]